MAGTELEDGAEAEAGTELEAGAASEAVVPFYDNISISSHLG